MAIEEQQQTETSVITLSANGKWNSGVQSSIKVRDFQDMVMDEPTDLGGTDEGPNPMEYVVGSFVGCFTVMLQLIGGELGVKVKDLEISAEGDIDVRGLFGTADVSPHFQAFRSVVSFTAEGPAEKIEELKVEAVKRCPAYNMLKDAGTEPKLDWRVQQSA